VVVTVAPSFFTVLSAGKSGYREDWEHVEAMFCRSGGQGLDTPLTSGQVSGLRITIERTVLLAWKSYCCPEWLLTDGGLRC
jgi:hypothetical protein